MWGYLVSLPPCLPPSPTTCCCCTLPVHRHCLLLLTLATVFYHHLQSVSFTKASVHHFLIFSNGWVSYGCFPSIACRCLTYTVICHQRVVQPASLSSCLPMVHQIPFVYTNPLHFCPPLYPRPLLTLITKQWASLSLPPPPSSQSSFSTWDILDTSVCIYRVLPRQ